MVGAEGDGLDVFLGELEPSRVFVAASSLGTAERALEIALHFAGERITFGKPIAARPSVQSELADMARDVYALRLILEDVAAKIDREQPCAVEASIAKLFGLETVMRVTDKAMDVVGGRAYFTDYPYPLERLYRECRINMLEEGTPSIQRLVIARSLLRAVRCRSTSARWARPISRRAPIPPWASRPAARPHLRPREGIDRVTLRSAEAQSAGPCAAIRRSASARSSSRLALKNGSTGAQGKATSTSLWLAVQRSILRSPCSTRASRRSARSSTGQSPNTGCARPSDAAQARSAPARSLASTIVSDQIVRQEGRIGGEARHQRVVRRVLRRPLESGQDPGERPGVALHHVGHHGHRIGREARGIAVGVQDQRADLGCRARNHPGEQGLAAERPAGTCRRLPSAAPGRLPTARPRPPSWPAFLLPSSRGFRHPSMVAGLVALEKHPGPIHLTLWRAHAAMAYWRRDGRLPMQTDSHILDDVARVATGAMGAASGLKGELDAMVRRRLEGILTQMDLVPRDEFDAVKEMAARARSES